MLVYLLQGKFKMFEISSAMLITGVADLLYERNVYGFIH